MNRSIYPSLDLENFFKLARDVGLSAVELRNDLPGGHVVDDLSTNQVRELTDKYQIRILTINAIQKLKREFRKDLVFWGGGVDTQHTLFCATGQQIRDDVRKNCEMMERSDIHKSSIFHFQSSIPASPDWEDIIHDRFTV